MNLDRKRELQGKTIPTRDGRNVDAELGALQGEASTMTVRRPEDAFPVTGPPVAPDADRTYYGLPVVKKPVWKAWIPTYFYTGGVAGAAAALGAAAQLAAPRRMRGLVVRARWLAAAGVAASSVLLIADLGRPARFLHMLRVVRLTSPMSVGTWIVAGSGLASGLAALGVERAGLVAGALGLPLSGYTAVLLSNTAIPAWLEVRGSLPVLFVASAAASGAAVLELLPASSREEARCLWTFAAWGKLAEMLAMERLERALRTNPRALQSLRSGRAGRLWRAAKLLSVAGLVATLLGRRRRRRRPLAGALSTLGALALRFAVAEAGKASARDPRATFEAQRR